MNKSILLIHVLLLLCFKCSISPQNTNNISYFSDKLHINPCIQKLLIAYPEYLISSDSNSITWNDKTKMIFNDYLDKDFDDMLNNPDLEDQFSMDYPLGEIYDIPKINHDPGRIRFEPFFKKMYGNTQDKVKQKLVQIVWLPSTTNKKLWVTSVNNIDEKLQTISNILDTLPQFHKYIDNPAGTFNWRKISETNRLSTHSFGIAIDININYSNYWKWDYTNTGKIVYHNQIPMEIVEIFEKYGFIWGGKWYHYDTMHFEYRPELLY